MAIKLTPESFLTVVKQSNLVPAEALKRLIAELRAEGIKLDNSRNIAEELVNREVLTRWQADKLLQGKHKGFFLGKYRLLRLLGKGGMSSVYLAEHVLMRRQCAIKVLPTKRVNDTSYLGRFHREAQAVASLDHPNIVRAYDVDKESEKDAEIHFLVMEYVNGRSLQELIQQDGPLDYVTAAEYVRQSANGLEHAHQAGMVHRDIKPGNLLIDRNETVKLLDMGLARFFNDTDAESLTVAHDEKVLGTADYLAPEQALDSHSVDARADIYSLGCTFYFLLTGHPPFVEGTLAQRLMSHQTKQPPSAMNDRPDIPADLLAILDRMMAKKREERFQTAEEVSEALAQWLGRHGPDSWRQAHPGLSGSGVGNGHQAGSPEAPVPPRPAVAAPVVFPAIPVAQPVMAVPPTVRAASVPSDEELALDEEDAGEELSAFLAHLGAADAGAGSEGSSWALSDDSAVLDEPPRQPEPVVTIAKAKPVESPAGKSRTAIPPNGPLPAKPVSASGSVPPVATAKPVSSAKVKPVAPVATAVPTATTAPAATVIAPPVAVSPVPPVAEPLPGLGIPAFDVSPVSRTKTVARPQRSREWKKLLQDKRSLALLGLPLVLLLAFGAHWLMTRPDKADGTDRDGNSAQMADGGLIGKPITVGPEGHFQSLNDALDYVNKHYNHDDYANAAEVQLIELAAGEVFEERIVREVTFNTSFQNGIRITSDPQNPAILKPSGPEPILDLANGVQDLQISHLKLDADGKPTAVRLRGDLTDTHLKNLSISGYTQTGVLAQSILGRQTGFDPLGRPVVLDGLKLQGAGKNTVGLLLDSASGSPVGGSLMGEILVQNCRFLGPMATGLEVKNNVTTLRILHNVFAGDGSGTGLLFSGSRAVLKRVVVGNNTFYNLARGVVFSEMLQTGEHLALHRNLFAEIKQADATLNDGDANQFLSRFLKRPALDANWTSRPKAGSPGDKKELKLFTGNNGQVDVKLEFVSTEKNHARFLAPKNSNSLPTTEAPATDIGPLSVDLNPWVGAVKP